jgi:hypothetical protein
MEQVRSFRVFAFLLCLFLSPALIAADAEISALRALHLEIVNEHLTASWTGASPGMSPKGVEFRAFIHNPDKRLLTLKVVELQPPHRQLSLSAKDGEVQELTLVGLDDKKVLTFTQSETGATLAPPGTTPALHGSSFRDLVREQTGAVQVNLLRPLSDMGVSFDPSPDLPVVMALAASGYAPPDPATLEKINQLLAPLTGKEEEPHAKALAELIKLYPLAIKHINDLAETTKDAALKQQLAAVIAAHPGIAHVREYVEHSALQNNRDYIKGIMTGVPLLREAAKMRLAEIDKK